MTAADEAVKACPTGSLLIKRIGYVVPVGQRQFDAQPIGSEIEAGETKPESEPATSGAARSE